MNIKTNLRAGQCYGNWQYGVVDKVEGNGYYAAVREANGNKRFVNYSYTEFYPNNQALWLGEEVYFTLHPQGWANAGKISCIQPVG